MKYDHGTHACYVLDKCRCDDCHRANRDYERERAARIEPAYVAAHPAREHVRALTEAGVGLKTIAKKAGVSHGALSKLMYGDPQRGSGPSKRVRKTTLDKILAVTPRDAADGAKVAAEPTWQLIDEMIAAGVPRVRIAEGIGQKGPGLQLSCNLIAARNARAVAELHAAWKAGTVTLDKRDRHGGSVVAEPPVEQKRPGADISDLMLDLAEIVEERNSQTWRSDAACRGRPTYLWFPARGDYRTAEKALKICNACMVRNECRAANIDKQDGIFGGLTGKARRELRASEAAA